MRRLRALPFFCENLGMGTNSKNCATALALLLWLPALAGAQPAPKAGGHETGEPWANPKDGLTYLWIPPGTFSMGCSPGDKECGRDEKPAHLVTLTKGFWLSQTLVTQQAYQRVTGKNPSEFKGPNLPVESLDWNEAKAYCTAVGARLPTEAEWEWAARARVTGSRYGILDRIAWHSGNSGSKTHEVGKKLANDFALDDMLGNVWQWVADWYGDYSAEARSDPSGAENGRYKALRGGSWYFDHRYIRLSSRDKSEPDNRSNDIGFRCAAD
jgi:formylglycine-generating enzyme required for sulfatase activity